MVLFLPSFVLPGFILLGFQQVCFHCSPPAANARRAVFGKCTHFCFLSVNDQGLNCCSTISNSSQKILPSSAKRVGMKPDKKLFVKCLIIAKSL